MKPIHKMGIGKSVLSRLIALIFIVLSGSVSSVGQTNVVKMNATKSNDFGVAYFLPKTVLRIDAEISKIEKKAGPYSKYAEKYLGISDVVLQDELYYNLDKVEVTGTGIPNKSEGYLIEFKSKTTAPFVYLTKDGLLCTINADYGDQEDFAGSVEKRKKSDMPQPMNPESVFTEEYLRAGSVSKQAEVAAKQIYRIRESRTDILTGESDNAPRDGEAMKIVLSQLEAQEKMLSELFTGTIKIEKQDATFELEPQSDIEKETIFRFSKYLGIVDADDLSGSPVYLNLKNMEPAATSEENSKNAKEKNTKSIVYNMPGKASVEVYFGTKSLFQGKVQVTQFGSTQTLATSIFEDKKAPVQIYFYPETGAIKQIIQ